VKELDITLDAVRKDHRIPAEHSALTNLGLSDQASRIMEDFRAEFETIRSLV